MARSSSPIEFSSFSKGLVTDNSPLNYQPDSAIDISNFELLRDGTVRRRKGFERVRIKNSSGNLDTLGSTPISSDRNNVELTLLKGMDSSSSLNILCVCFTLTTTSQISFLKLSDQGFTEIPVVEAGGGLPLSFLSVENIVHKSVANPIVQIGKRVVISDGEGKLIVVTYDESNDQMVEASPFDVEVRDVWGLPDEEASFTSRPFVLNDNDGTSCPNHIYNLRNSGWGRAIFSQDADIVVDPILAFFRDSDPDSSGDTRVPSLADNINEFIYPDTTSTTNPTMDRFNQKDCFNTVPSNFRAPYGSNIIKIFDRHNSRKNFIPPINSSDVQFDWGFTAVESNLSEEVEARDCFTTLESFAGRIWMAGASGRLNTKIDTSPEISNLVLFSRLVDKDDDVAKCYQVNDPTDKDNPDILDTDGGFIRIRGASNISKLIEYKDRLLVFADNGVWSIEGNDSSGFTSTGYRVTRISDSGINNPKSVVRTDNQVFYLNQFGVYMVAMDEVGSMTSTKASENLLDTYFNNKNFGRVSTASGTWSEYDNKVIWVMGDQSGSEELILDLNLGAYYVSSYEGDYNTDTPVLIDVLALNSNVQASISDNVVVGTDNVVSAGSNVILESKGAAGGSLDVIYITGAKRDGTNWLGLELAAKVNESFVDWEDYQDTVNDTTWVDIQARDAEAYLLTGYITGGDTQRYKQVPYLTMLFEKTEDGFTEDVEGNWNPTNESSCKVQAQWEWTNLASSNRWGREFEAYRHKRFYIPASLSDGYDDGHSVVVSKTKLRGKGRALSLKMRTEPGKDCHILGWSMVIGANNGV